MKIERLMNSKFYRGFEWFYRLLLLNVMIFTISFSLPAIPFLYWYKNQDSSFGIYILLFAAMMFIFAFIPAFISSFLVIKHYDEEQPGNMLVVFLKYLIDTIKRIYIIELIIIVSLIVLSFSVLFYWDLLSPDNFKGDIVGIISIVAFAIVFFLLVGLVFAFVNLTLIIAYFQMSWKDYFKLSVKYILKYFYSTLACIIILAIPLFLLFIIKFKFLPIYFIFGITGPQYIMYLINRNKYQYLQTNIGELLTENKLK